MSEAPETMRSSSTFLSDIVGEEALSGRILPTGSILDMMDIVAAECAFLHAKTLVATVSFDRVDLLMPFCHMDLVRCSGKVVSTGRSSMTIEVIAEKEDRMTRKFAKVCSSFVTMVAIDPKMLRPIKGAVPRLDAQSAEDVHTRELVDRKKKLFMEWQKINKAKLDSFVSAGAAIDETINHGKREYLSIPETKVTVRKQAMPRHLNQNQTVFGGDILILMEKLATYTAERFTGNEHALTLTMNRIAFKYPIRVEDVLQMEGSVVYVRKYVLEVEIRCFVDNAKSRELRLSHTGYFTVMNLDAIGFKREIMVGIKLDDNDPESIARYVQSKDRFNFDRQLKMKEMEEKAKAKEKAAEAANRDTKVTGGLAERTVIEMESELDRIRYAQDEDDSEAKFSLSTTNAARK